MTGLGMPIFIRQIGEHSFVLDLYIQPSSKKTIIAGLHGDFLKIKIHSPPVDGLANKSVLIFLQQLLDIKKDQLELISGVKSRYKRVLLTGIDINQNIFKVFEGLTDEAT